MCGYKTTQRQILWKCTNIEIFTFNSGIPRDELNQPAFSGLSVLNYPELHEDSIPHLNNFRMCQRMMVSSSAFILQNISHKTMIGRLQETCGITDYSINDLIAPNAKRLRRQLSGISLNSTSPSKLPHSTSSSTRT